MLLTVDAEPEPFAFDPGRTAVMAIDLQNDFGAEGGMVASGGLPRIDGARATIEPVARVLDAARERGILVVYTKMEFKRDLSNLGAPDSPNREKIKLSVGEGDFLIEGTWNTEIVPELVPLRGDVVISKQRYSAFVETKLDDVLHERGIKNLVFVGWTTSVCVESTLRDAFFRDYRCLILSDCTAEGIGSSGSRTNHEASLLVIKRLFGWVSDSTSMIATLAEAPAKVAPH